MRQYTGAAGILQAHLVHFLSQQRYMAMDKSFWFFMGPKTKATQRKNILHLCNKNRTYNPYADFAIQHHAQRPHDVLTWFVCSYIGVDCLVICDWLTNSVYVENYEKDDREGARIMQFAKVQDAYFDLKRVEGNWDHKLKHSLRG